MTVAVNNRLEWLKLQNKIRVNFVKSSSRFLKPCLLFFRQRLLNHVSDAVLTQDARNRQKDGMRHTVNSLQTKEQTRTARYSFGFRITKINECRKSPQQKWRRRQRCERSSKRLLWWSKRSDRWPTTCYPWDGWFHKRCVWRNTWKSFLVAKSLFKQSNRLLPMNNLFVKFAPIFRVAWRSSCRVEISQTNTGNVNAEPNGHYKQKQ